MAEAFYVQIFFWCTNVPFMMELTNFFYTVICWPGLGKKEVKSGRGCDIRGHGLDLPGTPWVVPHECHQVADTVEEVIWMKAKVPIVLDNPG